MLALQIKYGKMPCEFSDIAPSGWVRTPAGALFEYLEMHGEGVSLKIAVQ